MPYSARSPYTPQQPIGSHSRNIMELMQRSGDIEAQRSANSGAIWGNALQQLGGIAGQAVEQYGQRKEQKKLEEQRAEQDGRFSAMIPYISKMPPEDVLAETVSIYGSEKGPEIAKGLFGLQKMTMDLATSQQALEAGDQELAAAKRAEAEATLGAQVRAIDALGGPNSPLGAEAVSHLAQVWSPVVGADISPDAIIQNWEQIKKQYGPEPEPLQQIDPTKDLYRGGELVKPGVAPPVDPVEAQLAQLRLEGAQLGNEKTRAEIEAARAKAAAGPEEPKLAAGLTDTVARLDQALGIGDQLRADVDESWLGPVAGRATELSIKTPGIATSEKLARFYANTATLKNATIKAITGAQMSEGEAERIMQQIPDFSDKPGVWKEKLAASERNLKMLKKRILELSGRSSGEAPLLDDPLGLFQ